MDDDNSSPGGHEPGPYGDSPGQDGNSSVSDSDSSSSDGNGLGADDCNSIHGSDGLDLDGGSPAPHSDSSDLNDDGRATDGSNPGPADDNSSPRDDGPGTGNQKSDPSSHVTVKQDHVTSPQGDIYVTLPNPKTRMPVHEERDLSSSPPSEDAEEYVTAPSQPSQPTSAVAQAVTSMSKIPERVVQGLPDANITELISQANVILSDEKQLKRSKPLRSELEEIQLRCLQHWLESPVAKKNFTLSFETDKEIDNGVVVYILCISYYYSNIIVSKYRPGNKLTARDVERREIRALTIHLRIHNQTDTIKTMALYKIIRNIPWLGKSANKRPF